MPSTHLFNAKYEIIVIAYDDIVWKFLIVYDAFKYKISINNHLKWYSMNYMNFKKSGDA